MTRASMFFIVNRTRSETKKKRLPYRAADQRTAFTQGTGIDIVHDEQVDQMADLEAFAAQVAAMDLVVSIDNSTAHLAGALDVPTWVLLRSVPFWLWGLDRDDSLWCSSMSLFRQKTSGDWADVVERAAQDLAGLSAP